MFCVCCSPCLSALLSVRLQGKLSDHCWAGTGFNLPIFSAIIRFARIIWCRASGIISRTSSHGGEAYFASSKAGISAKLWQSQLASWNRNMKLVFSLPLKLLSEKNWLFLGLGNGIGYLLIKFQLVGSQASHCHYSACISWLAGLRVAFDKSHFCAQIRRLFWALRCADLFSSLKSVSHPSARYLPNSRFSACPPSTQHLKKSQK